MATLTESTPLDLSLDKIKAPSSPMNAVPESREHVESERSSSVSSMVNSSDGNESDTSTTTAVKPVSAQLTPTNGSETKVKYESEPSRSRSTTPTSLKMFPVDGIASMYSNPLVSAAGAFSAAAAANTAMANSAALGIPSLYESSLPPLPLTPLTSHLLQRKRRAENREMIDENNKKTTPVPEDKKDEAYWERRRKNNEAAKRSRDARRQKEEEIAMRAAFLEQENLKLRAQVAILKNETAKLHYMLYNRIWVVQLFDSSIRTVNSV